MFRYLYYIFLFLSILLFGNIQVNAQGVPELMYFKFNTISNGLTPNDANPSTRLGDAMATVEGNLAIGGTGQFGTGLQGHGGTSSLNYLNPNWTSSYNGSWTISFYADIPNLENYPTQLSSQFFFGSHNSSAFRCFTGGSMFDAIVLRGTYFDDVIIPNIHPGPLVVTFTYDHNSQIMKGYKNGVLITTKTNQTGPTILSSDFKIAGNHNENGLNGLMDEFRFYNRALDETEVAAVWNQTLPLLNCTSIPNLDTISGPNNICPNNPFTLIATGIDQAGITYQWQESSSGVNNWTNIQGANTGTLSIINGLNTPMDYRIIATCINSSLSDTSAIHSVQINEISTCYCIPPMPHSIFYYHIESVSTNGAVNNFSNLNTGFSLNGYGDFTSTHTVTTFPSGVFNIEVLSQEAYDPGIKIWIDWNQNGIFEPNELVYDYDLGSPNFLNNYVAHIQVPADAVLGTTRMRIRNYKNQEPCNKLTNGETEDYSVEIIALNDCNLASAGTIMSDQSVICPDDDFLLTTYTILNPGNGLTYQWQSSPSGQNNWTDIIGANSIFYSGSGINGDTDFRLKVYCSFSNLEDFSNTITINEKPVNECYCIPPTPVYENAYWIDGVKTTGALNNIFNLNTGYTPGGYINYGNIHQIKTSAGENFDLEIQSQSVVPGIKVWIDWNQNGIFESNELVYSSIAGVNNSLNTYTTNIQVPTNVTPGYANMRIRNYISTQPCNHLSYGETEDYLIIFADNANCNVVNTGTIYSSHIQACTTDTFELHAVGATEPTTGITYQWQSSPVGANTWSDIPNANALNYFDTGINGDTDFRFKVNCSFGNLESISNIITINVIPQNFCYCIPPIPGASNTWVESVITTNAINNFSNIGTGNSSIGYADYINSHIVTSNPGGVFDLEVELNHYLTTQINIWIDWNQNGVFDSDELVFEDNIPYQTTPNGYYTFNIPINVPMNASLGTTKMRIRTSYIGSLNSCEQSFGETEDYGVEIIALQPCTGIPTASISGVDSICPEIEFTLHGTEIFNTGITYQWQQSNNGQSNWVNIPGAIDDYYTATNGINATTFFRLIATCTNSNQSDSSAIKEVTLDLTECYCEPIYSMGCSVGDRITNVTLIGENVTLNNSSECSPNGYGDYRGLVDEPDLLQGETYTISVSTDYGNPQSENLRVWIDWNQNGIFEANEQIANTMGQGMGDGTFIQNFTVPSNLSYGQYTMRARMVYQGTTLIDPCNSYDYGETEDYLVVIGTPCQDPIVDLGADTTICVGESITLDAGNPGLEYQWSNNASTQTISVNQAGTYYVTVFDEDCYTTDSITISLQNPPIVNLGNDTTVCNGEVVTLNAGNPGAIYLWNNNSTAQTLQVTEPGTYHVTVSDGQCTTSDSINIYHFPNPSIEEIIVNNEGECNFTFTAHNPLNVDFFVWDFGDGSTPAIGMNVSHTYTEYNSYNVTLTVTNECGYEVNYTKVIHCEAIGIKDLNSDSNLIQIYPNPSNDLINIKSKLVLMESVTIYNILGQNVYENKELYTSSHVIDVAKFPSGFYSIRIQIKDGYINRKLEIIK